MFVSKCLNGPGDPARVVAGLGLLYARRRFKDEVRTRFERLQDPSGGRAESSSASMAMPASACAVCVFCTGVVVVGVVVEVTK